MDVWVEGELDGVEYPDRRLKSVPRQDPRRPGPEDRRHVAGGVPGSGRDQGRPPDLQQPAGRRGHHPGGALRGHPGRFAATSGPIPVVHVTTEFSFRAQRTEGIGQLSPLKGRHATHTVWPAHALRPGPDPRGVPLGLAAVEFWTREKVKGTNALRGKVNPARIPIERKEVVRWPENLKQSTASLGDAARCVHIGDREGDIFELFCAAHEVGADFLVRTCVDRPAGRGGTTISKKMGASRSGASTRSRSMTTGAEPRRPRSTCVLPDDGAPADRRAAAPPRVIADGHPRPRAGGTPAGGEAIRWNLLTNRPVEDLTSAIEKLDWMPSAGRSRLFPRC